MSVPITPDERDAMRRLALTTPQTPGEHAYVEHVPRLLDALDTAEAEVARLRAAHDLIRSLPYTGTDVREAVAALAKVGADPAPVWDEEAVVAAVARAIALAGDYDGCFERLDSWADASDEARECGDVEEPLSTDAEDAEFWHSRARVAVAVVRRHLPVRPDRETIARAILNRYSSFDLLSAYGIADAVLNLWPTTPDDGTFLARATLIEKEK